MKCEERSIANFNNVACFQTLFQMWGTFTSNVDKIILEKNSTCIIKIVNQTKELIKNFRLETPASSLDISNKIELVSDIIN